jgi:predicted DNA-binding transcriptional regulator YafY
MRTAGRLLRLLTLLQGRRAWSGAELSERLRVDARTIRRDVDRLRELGYVIEASAGPGGGYRLGAGNATPPLLLEDEEAVAVAAALGAAAGSVSGAQEVALRVLVKLDQLLPSRLRHRLSALQAVTVPLVAGAVSMADPFVLTGIATACHDRELLGFTYKDRKGDVTERSVEPERLVHTGRVWYLVAWDLGRSEWRTFRVDRIDARMPVARGGRFTPRPPPEDIAAFVSHSMASVPHSIVVHLRLAAAAAELSARVPPWVGALQPNDDRSCFLTIGAETIEAAASYIVHLPVAFEILGPAEVLEPLREIAARLARAAESSPAREARPSLRVEAGDAGVTQAYRS